MGVGMGDSGIPSVWADTVNSDVLQIPQTSSHCDLQSHSRSHRQPPRPSSILGREGEEPRTSGRSYLAVVQVVLLFCADILV